MALVISNRRAEEKHNDEKAVGSTRRNIFACITNSLDETFGGDERKAIYSQFENTSGMKVEEALVHGETTTRSFVNFLRSEFGSGTAALIETMIVIDLRSKFRLPPPSSAKASSLSDGNKLRRDTISKTVDEVLHRASVYGPVKK